MSTDTAPTAAAGGREETGVFPVLEGTLGHLLPHRWFATPDETRREVCRHDSIEQALVAAIRVLHGAHAVTSVYPFDPDQIRVMWLLDGTPDALRKKYPNAPVPEVGQKGLLGIISVTPADRANWNRLVTDDTETGRTSTDDEDEMLRARDNALASRLWVADVLWSMLDEALVAATVRMPRWQALLDPALRLWWHRAISTGHSVDSAKVMLGLISDPATLSHVTEWPTPEDPLAGMVVDPRVVFPQV